MLGCDKCYRENKVDTVDRERWHGHCRFKLGDQRKVLPRRWDSDILERKRMMRMSQSVLGLGMDDGKLPEVEQSCHSPRDTLRGQDSWLAVSERNMEKMQEAKEGPGTQWWLWGDPMELPWALLWSINRKVEWEVGAQVAQKARVVAPMCNYPQAKLWCGSLHNRLINQETSCWGKK